MIKHLPHGMTEGEVLDTVERVVTVLAPNFTFGYFGVEDIQQEARLFALEALARYDNKRPLENFLCTHVKNRLINFRRDKFHRNDPPCPACHQALPGQTPHEGGQYCKAYRAWKRRNESKQNLMRPLGIESVQGHTTASDAVSDQAERRELFALIDEKLPIELRPDYLRIRAGVKLPKSRRTKVENALKVIFGLANAVEGDFPGEDDDQ